MTTTVDYPANNFNTPINPCTLLNTIPNGFSYAAMHTINYDIFVAHLGEFNYSVSKKRISKRLAKRPRKGEATIIQEVPHRSISWKLGKNNPQKEAGDTTSALHAFARDD